MLNRERLLAAIGDAIDADASCVGILILRMQHLREFEMVFGYVAAEQLAERMQERLRQALRLQDVLLRIGDNDFAMVLPGLLQRQHAALAAAKVVRTVWEPFMLEGGPARASVAVGIATWPEDGDDPAALCQRADGAVLAALQVRERHAFNPSVPDRIVQYAALHEAIAGNRLQTWLQPIFKVADDTLVGFESLSRWRLDGEWVPPEQFVVMAEQTGLIEAMTHWSLNSTLRHCAPLLRSHPGLVISVNLSPRAILDHGIVQQIDAALRLWSVPPHALKVEVTETAFVEDAAGLAEVLRELHAMGVGVSIDDYGTGYSSLKYLRDFPVDEIKIDRSFVADVARHARSAQLVEAIIGLGHRFGAQTVAEGVESADALALLKTLGCDRYQGYLKAPPRPATEIVEAMGRDVPRA